CGTTPTLTAFRKIANARNARAYALIGVGEFITNELEHHRLGTFGGWLTDSIGGITATDTRLVRALASLGAKLATTNYDDMIESGTGRSPITWKDRALATVFVREPTQSVLHLHGHYRQPNSVILGARSYGEICSDEFA